MCRVKRLAVSYRLARARGARLVVRHLCGLTDEDAHLERYLAALPACYDLAADHGVELAIETISCDHGGPLTHLRRAVETDSRCLAALDTEFRAFHGQLDEALTADRLWPQGRVRHVHANDFDGSLWTPEQWRRYLHPGHGRIHFEAVFAALRARGYPGAVSLEASSLDADGQVNMRQLLEGLSFLQAMTLEPVP